MYVDYTWKVLSNLAFNFWSLYLNISLWTINMFIKNSKSRFYLYLIIRSSISHKKNFVFSKLRDFKKMSSNFSVNPTLPPRDFCWCFLLQIVRISLFRSLFPSFSLTHSLCISLFCSNANIKLHTEKCIFKRRNFLIKWCMILKVTWGHFYVEWLLKSWRPSDLITTLT